MNLQKTRLHDPLLGFHGLEQSSGRLSHQRLLGLPRRLCERSLADATPAGIRKYGNQGLSFSGDKAIRKDERGHPIKHQFTRAIPSSQCMNCHMHQGNLFVNPYLGYTWWDQETDGEFMYPKQAEEPDRRGTRHARSANNPEAAAARGLWGDLDFLEKVAELNPKLKHTQFADYHGHGWIFRAVFKQDRKGNLLDLDDNIIPHDDPQKFAKAVHLKDVHLAHGMQCVDCHFDADVHGNGTALRRTARRHDHRVHRLPRHDRAAPDARHTATAALERRARSRFARRATRRGARALSGKGTNCSSARR